MAGIPPQRLVQLGDGGLEPVRPSLPSDRRGEQVVISRGRGGRLLGASAGRVGSLRLAPQRVVASSVEPESAGGGQAGDRLGPIEQTQGLPGRIARPLGQADAGVGQEQEQLAPVLRQPPAILRGDPEPGRVPVPLRVFRRPEEGERSLAGRDPFTQVVLQIETRVDQAERPQDARVVGADLVARPGVGQLVADAREDRADRQQDQRRDPARPCPRRSSAGAA